MLARVVRSSVRGLKRYVPARLVRQGLGNSVCGALAIVKLEVKFIWPGHAVGELTENIMGNIVGNIVGIIVGDAVSVIVLAAEPLLLAEAV